MDKRQYEALLKKHGFHFSHSLGQNFIFDKELLAGIADLALHSGSENVLEIGAGAGTLTAELALRAKRVVSLEIDRALLSVLHDYLSPYDNVTVVCADVMQEDLTALTRRYFGTERFCVAANLPYYITTPVVMLLLESGLPIERMALMVQREVAARMAAQPGSKDYGALTLAVGYRTRARIALEAPAEMFTPQPKVDSCVVTLDFLDEPPIKVVSESIFFRVVRSAFAMRRKTMANNLCASFGLSKQEAADMLAAAGAHPSARGETLSLAQIGLISDALAYRSGLE